MAVPQHPSGSFWWFLINKLHWQSSDCWCFFFCCVSNRKRWADGDSLFFVAWFDVRVQKAERDDCRGFIVRFFGIILQLGLLAITFTTLLIINLIRLEIKISKIKISSITGERPSYTAVLSSHAFQRNRKNSQQNYESKQTSTSVIGGAK